MCDPVTATIGVVGGMMMANQMQPEIPKPPPVPQAQAVAKQAEKEAEKSPTNASSRANGGMGSTLITGSRGLTTKALTAKPTLLGSNTKLGQ